VRGETARADRGGHARRREADMHATEDVCSLRSRGHTNTRNHSVHRPRAFHEGVLNDVVDGLTQHGALKLEVLEPYAWRDEKRLGERHSILHIGGEGRPRVLLFEVERSGVRLRIISASLLVMRVLMEHSPAEVERVLDERGVHAVFYT